MKFNFFINRAIKKVLKENKKSPQYLRFDEIKQVLIIFNIEDWEVVHWIIHDLKKENKRVIAWTLRESTRTGTDPKVNFPEGVKVIDLSKEVSWLQIPKPTLVKAYEELQYDTLLDLTTRKKNILTYFLAKKYEQPLPWYGRIASSYP